jgi:hypothetical protein
MLSYFPAIGPDAERRCAGLGKSRPLTSSNLLFGAGRHNWVLVPEIKQNAASIGIKRRSPISREVCLATSWRTVINCFGQSTSS